MRKKSQMFGLIMLFMAFFIESAYAQELTREGDGTVMCSVSSTSSENYGRCYTTPSGGKNCSLLATAGNACNGTIVVN